MITLSWSGMRQLDCLFRFKAMQVERTHKEPPTPEMELGSAVHKTIEALLRGTVDADLIPPSVDVTKYEEMVKTWQASEFCTNKPKNAMIERKLAISTNGKSCDFFAKDAMFRGIIDFAYQENGTISIVDWKTGRWEVDPNQMRLYALLMSADQSGLEEVETIIYNLQSNTIIRKTYYKEEIEEAHGEIVQTSIMVNGLTDWPATPCWLCDKCTVPGCPERDKVSNALVVESKIPALRLPESISTQLEAETALQFVLFAESVTDRVKRLIKGYVQENGPIYSAGKVAQFSDRETWKPKDLSLLTKSLASWGVPKDLIWDSLSLTKTGLDKIIKKAILKDQEPLIKAMCDIKSTKTFAINNDKTF